MSDNKKVQTVINIVCEAVDRLKEADDVLDRVYAAYVDQGVDPTGTPLEGNLTAIVTWMAALKDVADSAIANGFLEHRAPTHGNMALGDIW